MKVLIFGNKLVEGDNLGLKFMDRLGSVFEDVEFVEVDATEDLQNYGRELKIIDAVVGIEDVRVLRLNSLEDFDRLKVGKVYSMHDFDLGYNLKLLKKMGLIDSVEIICLPVGGKEGDVFNQTQSILKKWVAQLMQGS